MTLEEFNALPNRMFITKCPICHSPQTINLWKINFPLSPIAPNAMR